MERQDNLFGLLKEEVASRLAGLGLPQFRARQVYRWMYRRRADRFEAMTDLPRSVREELDRRFLIRHPDAVRRDCSRDGTVKFLFRLEEARSVEAVYIPDPPLDFRCAGGGEKAKISRQRHTVCLSTQVGCPLKCSFCFSGTVPFARNLSAGEIVGQLLRVQEEILPASARLNVVFMGMGEPLLNEKALLASLRILTDPDGFGISPRRITVSTAGMARELEHFAKSAPPVGLAVSLHATSNETRGRMMPINRRYPLEELLEVTRRLPLPRRRRITFEYVLLGGENDSEEDARRLADLLRGAKAKVNLIAFNPWPGTPHRPSTAESTDRFMRILCERGLTASLRRSRGDDILAACGQLAATGGEVLDHALPH